MILIHSAATTNPEQEAQSSYMALIPGAKSHWDAIQKGILGLEDKKTALKTCTMEKSWSRYYVLFHKGVPGGFMWKLGFLLGIGNTASAVIILWWSA